MGVVAGSLVVVYCLASLALLAHPFFQLLLAAASWRGRDRRSSGSPTPSLEPPAAWPRVTVQLPIYNERHVAGRVVDRAAALEYPPGLLDIQVLDDSDDDTVGIVAARVEEHRARGVRIEHVRREVREGYKAGALRDAMGRTRGELVALFDADFAPDPDFLLATVPHFRNPAVAAVQARWEHMNRFESTLTRAQALMLDAHFVLEQQGRAALGCFINFNGTAGVWRTSAIREAGNWSADTLTEDLDLSYRTQLSGWRLVFLVDVVTPAELPGDMRAFRRQQFRWMKGLAQNTRRLVPRIWRSELSRHVKWHACAHLLESATYVPIFAMLLLTPPLAVLQRHGLVPLWVFFNPMLLGSTVALLVVYSISNRALRRDGVGALVFTWLAFMVLTFGVCVHNTMAVFSGWARDGGEFARTPKRGEARRSSYLPSRADVAPDCWVLAYLGASIIWGARTGCLSLLWLPMFGSVCIAHSVVSAVRAGRGRAACARSTA